MNKQTIKLTTLAFVAIVTATAIFSSCQKDSQILPDTKTENNKTENTAMRPITIGYYFTWDHWGRASRDCAGGGLCNFRLEKIVINLEIAQPVQSDENGNTWVDIPISNDMPAEYNYDFFPVDEDMTFTMDDGDTFMVASGMYPRNNSIGTNGGYRLPIIQL